MKFTIRNMNKQDIQQVQHVAKTSWHDTYEGIIPLEIQNRFLKTAYSDKRLVTRIENSYLFVAECKDKIVGFANFSPVQENGRVELSAIYLDPAHQGKGIGTALFQEGIKCLKGVNEVLVHVEKVNQIGIDFYRAKGFKVVSEFEEDFDGHLLKTICMSLKI